MLDDRAGPALTFAVAAGVFGAVQPRLNAELGVRVDSALLASLVNFGVALIIVLVAVSLRPKTRIVLRDILGWDVPPWMLTAGLGGAIVVLAGALTVDTIGVAVFSVAFFAGQIVAGLLVDRVGLAPGGNRPITAARLVAIAFAGCAVVAAQVGRAVGEFAPAAVAFVVAAGAAVAFQSAFNGRITRATGDPVAATAVNVSVGTIALAAIVASLAIAGSFGPASWPSEPWLYAGGALGVSVVLALAIATAALGVLRTTVTMLAAQMVGAIAVDWIVEHEPPTAGVLLGATLIIAAVAAVGRRQAAPAGSV